MQLSPPESALRHIPPGKACAIKAARTRDAGASYTQQLRRCKLQPSTKARRSSVRVDHHRSNGREASIRPRAGCFEHCKRAGSIRHRSPLSTPAPHCRGAHVMSVSAGVLQRSRIERTGSLAGARALATASQGEAGQRTDRDDKSGGMQPLQQHISQRRRVLGVKGISLTLSVEAGRRARPC